MVTKKQFIDAQKVIRQYNEQQLKGKYQFIFYKTPTSECSEKWIEAKDLDNACYKMAVYLRGLKSDFDILIDYEVMFKGKYIDISEDENLREFIF